MQVDLRSFVRNKETARWQGKKNGISRSASKVVNKPFRYLIRLRQTFYPANRGPSIFLDNFLARPLKTAKKVYLN